MKAYDAETKRQQYNANRRARYAANREELRARKRDLYSVNPEPQRIATLAHYHANLDRYKTQRQQQYLANPEPANRRSRAWQAANPERKRILSQIWDSTHHVEKRATQANRRARVKQAFIEPINPKLVYERDNGVCQLCDEPIGDAKWHIDHIFPLVRGGKHSYENVQLAHARCNQSKGAKVPA